MYSSMFALDSRFSINENNKNCKNYIISSEACVRETDLYSLNAHNSFDCTNSSISFCRSIFEDVHFEKTTKKKSIFRNLDYQNDTIRRKCKKCLRRFHKYLYEVCFVISRTTVYGSSESQLYFVSRNEF